MRAVFFDLDGTLVELPDDFFGLFEAALADHGVSADLEQCEFYTEAFFGYLDDCHAEPYRAAMTDLRAEYDLAASAEALAETYTEREAAATDLRPGVRETLDALAADESSDSADGDVSAAATDTALGVLTNGAARAQHHKLAHHGLADRFDAVVVSGEVGAAKPDQEIFAAATEAIPADEHVFVADDLERDVRPAQEAGFTGVHVAEDEDARSAAGDENRPAATDSADFAVTSVRDVPDLLG
ncbi:HAD family hydrolase [Halorussus salinisoli]|uniref:HAD family hydrolase n=1 Tax=Halorussus salinisoli TaxID=2558242 RepID=UPI0010C1FC4C|nr:HAD family hydrolase [Halorussus salinisoli]